MRITTCDQILSQSIAHTKRKQVWQLNTVQLIWCKYSLTKQAMVLFDLEVKYFPQNINIKTN
jgi:hypothetical protein